MAELEKTSRGVTLPAVFVDDVEAEAIKQFSSVPKQLQKAWKFYMEHKNAG